jgi:aspartate racemase
MGPAATAEFLRLLVQHTPAERDQDHPPVIVLSDPTIPDRSAAILASATDPTPRLRSGLLRLADCGADVLAIPCNTAHVFIEPLLPELSTPFVHIADATLRQARLLHPTGSWLLATRGTLRSRMYQDWARRLEYRLVVPDEAEQCLVDTAVAYVKANRTPAAAGTLATALERLWARHDLPVIAACTELPLAYAATRLVSSRMCSSLEALAVACLHELGIPPRT